MGKYADIRIVPSTDGSHTLEVPSMAETYHSVHGAWTESMHVYIENGLEQLPAKGNFRILEVGFGTGLNAFLTLLKKGDRKIEYNSIELNPLGPDIYSKLNYPRNDVEKELFMGLHEAPWDKDQEIRKDFTLRKIHSDIKDAELSRNDFQLVYYDAFAPSRQPEMWEMDILKPVIASMDSGGILVTYCAQGQFKRNLRQLGLEVDSIEGPPGKNEMVRALRT